MEKGGSWGHLQVSETNRPKPKQGKESFLRGMPWLSFSYFSNSATAYYHACKWKYALTHVCVRTCGRRATSNFPFFFGSFWLFLLSLSVFPREQKPKMEKREREKEREMEKLFFLFCREGKRFMNWLLAPSSLLLPIYPVPTAPHIPALQKRKKKQPRK